jgi:peptidoglycan/xylan/chitin deacetylase (PgdA/CDA1 family)
MDHSRKVVYLTFDDGPIPEATPYVLDVLDEMGIKATFFMVGENALRYPHLLDEVRKRGHRIGNHSFNHIAGMRWSTRQYYANILKAEQVLKSGKLFRPAHGWAKPKQYLALRRKGWRIVMWDLVTRDYSKWLTADDVVNNVKKYTRNGSIITFHDSLKSIDKLRLALPESIKWLKEQGYEFKIFE